MHFYYKELQILDEKCHTLTRQLNAKEVDQ